MTGNKKKTNLFDHITKLLFHNRLHTWLRSTMTTERLSDLAVIAMHSNAVCLETEQICCAFMELHPRKMLGSSLLE